MTLQTRAPHHPESLYLTLAKLQPDRKQPYEAGAAAGLNSHWLATCHLTPVEPMSFSWAVPAERKQAGVEARLGFAPPTSSDTFLAGFFPESPYPGYIPTQNPSTA